MNYIKIHDQIIERAKNRTIFTYSEKHHILPKCLGGLKYDKSNIVALTAREHYVIHKLLIRIYPNNRSLIYALWAMSNGSKKDRPKVFSSRDYQYARTLFSATMKGQSYVKGKTWKKKNPISQEEKQRLRTINLGNKYWVGKKHKEESRLKQSKSALTRKTTEEGENKRREGISRAHKGVKQSEEHRIKGSIAKMGSKNPMFGKKWKKVNGKRIYL